VGYPRGRSSRGTERAGDIGRPVEAGGCAEESVRRLPTESGALDRGEPVIGRRCRNLAVNCFYRFQQWAIRTLFVLNSVCQYEKELSSCGSHAPQPPTTKDSARSRIIITNRLDFERFARGVRLKCRGTPMHDAQTDASFPIDLQPSGRLTRIN
jgi:hypothetical protein